MKRILPILLLSLFFAGIIMGSEPRDRRKESLRELVTRADKGEAKALYELAKLHDTGYDTIPVDSLRSTALYLLAAQKSYAPAENFIGFRYYNGEILDKNIDSAIYWISRAADEGDITAASNLGYLLSQAPDVQHDYDKALFFLTKAAEAKFPSALSQLGDMKRLGLGIPADTLAAAALYEQAAEAGVRDAQLKLLAMMGYRWKSLPMDSALALGIKYYRGHAPIAGVDLIEQAAEKGNPKALALLGDAYSKGRGVNYDHKKSIDYFHEAALKGDPSAQFIFAELLEFFPDEARDETPEFWYGEAAKSGIADSESAYRQLLTAP